MSLILAGMLPLLIIIFLIFFFSFVPIGLWISAIAAGVKVSLMSLVGMRLRRVPLSDYTALYQSAKGRSGNHY